MFAFRATTRAGGLDGSTVEVAFTDAELDLGDRAEPESLAQALARVETACGAAVVGMRQVHGADVAVVGPDPAGAGTPWPTADALVTTSPGLALMTRVADCLPVLMADPSTGVVAAVHAGRAGLVADVVTRTAERMRTLGAGDLIAWLGPRVCGACYEVPASMRAAVADVVPEAWAQTRWGTPSVDLAAGVTAQLRAAGCAVVGVDRCTREDPGLHSHRRDGPRAGRLAGLVWRSP